MRVLRVALHLEDELYEGVKRLGRALGDECLPEDLLEYLIIADLKQRVEIWDGKLAALKSDPHIFQNRSKTA
jgi:hypothetical protein